MPIRSAGRFAHEAVDIDPATGFLYLTEDNFDFPSGFYRYRAPQNPMTAQAPAPTAGSCEMLKIEGRDNAVLDKGQTPGVTYGVEWVKIDEPDTDVRAGHHQQRGDQAVGAQGRAKGAAIFSRLEGIFYDSGKVYLVSTQGGDTPPGEPPPAGYGDGFGQLWVYDTGEATLTLLFESPSRTVLELPDNLCISPRKCSLLCEDGPARTSCAASRRRARSSTSRATRSRGADRRSSRARRSRRTARSCSSTSRHQRPDVRDLGAVEARRAVARRH